MNMFLAFIVAFVAITGSAAMNVPEQAEAARRVRAGSVVGVEARDVEENFSGKCPNFVQQMLVDECDHAGSAQCVFPGDNICGWGKKRQMYVNCKSGLPHRTCDTACFKPCEGTVPTCEDTGTEGCKLINKSPCTSKCGYGTTFNQLLCAEGPRTCVTPCCCKRCEGSGNTQPVHPCTKDIEVPEGLRVVCCPWTLFP